MKNFIPILKKTLRGGYRKYFYFWLFALFSFALSISFFMIETKRFLALQESQKKLNESFQRLQPQVLKIKERLQGIDWNRDFSKKTISLSLTLDLGNLPQALKDLQELTKEENSYFVIEKMTFNQEKDKPSLLLLQGMIIKYNI